ncbi:ribonuclease III [compost metagenome]
MAFNLPLIGGSQFRLPQANISSQSTSGSGLNLGALNQFGIQSVGQQQSLPGLGRPQIGQTLPNLQQIGQSTLPNLQQIGQSTLPNLQQIGQSTLPNLQQSTLTPIGQSTLTPIGQSTLTPIGQSTLTPIGQQRTALPVKGLISGITSGSAQQNNVTNVIQGSPVQVLPRIGNVSNLSALPRSVSGNVIIPQSSNDLSRSLGASRATSNAYVQGMAATQVTNLSRNAIAQSVSDNVAMATLPNRRTRGPLEIYQANFENSKEWILDLQQMIATTIAPLVEPNTAKQGYLTDESAMGVWAVAFTDETYNPNVGENYESLEKIGDAFMKAAFLQYLEERYPDINQYELSEMINYYLSKPRQAEIALKLGLNKYVRTNVTVSTHMFEDLLEAVFGALQKIGTAAHSVGVGYAYAYNLIVSIYNDTPLDRGVTVGNPKTQIKQIFDKMGWGTVGERWDENSGTFSILVPRQATSTFREHGINGEIIAYGRGNTQKVASADAYPRALRFLSEHGITQAWADSQKNTDKLDLPELRELYQNALSKARSEGLESLSFTRPKITSSECFYQLIGSDSNGRLTVLVTIAGCSLMDAKRDALETYLSS